MRKSAAAAAAAILVFILSAAPMRGEDAGGGFGPGRPPMTPIHWWEDFGFLRDKEQRIDYFDPFKYVPLDDSNKSYFTAGLELKERYENWSNAALGNGPPRDQDGYLLRRTSLRTDLHLIPHFRIYTELKSCFEDGREGPDRAFDEDRLDLLAGFVEMGCDLGTNKSIDFRIGRQEMHYGLGRVIEVRDSLNNRQGFDEVKMMLNLGNWQVDGFYGRPVEDKVGVFDNSSSEDFTFSGIYAACRKLPGIKGAGLDVYALHNDLEKALFFKGIQNEHRSTVGARLYGTAGHFHYDIEPDYQFGNYGDGHISAWATSNEIGYVFAKGPASPDLNLHLDAFSGDRGAKTRNLGTFNSLFPRGQYFSEPSPIGKQNIIDVRPAIEWHPHRDLTFTTANVWYWRQSLHDGTYYFNGFPQLPPGNNSRFVGSETILNLEWRVNPHTVFTTAFSHFISGDFVRKSHGRDFNFLAMWVTFRF